ncbi:methyltransferase [Diplonema papillatum]|nr:methyltransferase [Diplonema papillatum]
MERRPRGGLGRETLGVLIGMGLVVVATMALSSQGLRLYQSRTGAAAAGAGTAEAELSVRLDNVEVKLSRLRDTVPRVAAVSAETRELTVGLQRISDRVGAVEKLLAGAGARQAAGGTGGDDGGSDDPSKVNLVRMGEGGSGDAASAAAAGKAGSDAVRQADGSGANDEARGSDSGGVVSRQSKGEGVLSPVIADIECPPVSPSVHMEIPLEHLPRKKKTTVAQKYDRRAGNCNGKGLWSAVSREDHYKIMKRMAKLLDIKRNDVIFDWGSGCGHKLMWFNKEWNTSGLGVDLSYKSLMYAWENTTAANKFCYGDGSVLDWIPDNTFDAVFSFGAIFHVYNQDIMCRSYREMVRIAKKGGKVYNGWSAEEEFPNIALYHCLHDIDVEKIEVFEERKTLYKGIKTFPTKYKGYGYETTKDGKRERRLLRPISYSHLITK